MGYLIIVMSFIFVISFILSLILRGKAQQEAKEHLKEIINSPDGVIILIVAVALLIGGIYFVLV
ncbi:hypothetical protein [Bacillus mycoides]|uniref:hypothetical protein n=1 Tax=Bacillus mycoides TaxID=1405 RepID=UPI003D1B8E65